MSSVNQELQSVKWEHVLINCYRIFKRIKSCIFKIRHNGTLIGPYFLILQYGL